MSQRRLASVLFASILFLGVTPRESAGQSYADVVWEQLQAVYGYAVQAGDYTLGNYVMGKLNDGESDTWTFNFYGNSDYLITAACDIDCGDIDITVLDSRGNLIAQDTEVDDAPVVEIRTGRAETVTVEVTMFDCTAEPCYWGFGIFYR